MLDGVSAVLGSAKVAYDLTKGLLDLKEGAAVQEKAIALTGILIELQGHLISAQQEHMALLKRVNELEQLLDATHTKRQKFERYRLHQFPKGSSAYVLRDEHHTEEPKHYICGVCLESEQKVILQPRAMGLVCPKCEAFVYTSQESL
ncbi:hypothetical protein [Pseudomonas sp. 1928-m]|uniref:hypothetical protein n=1 Tax=Pseudomonas sp. 1928-m TaxID=3033804 RepID=UPI0023DE6C02|nr:hypothetical protein [Pseudomonas sp. 1928-m]MDF3196717.1 hypothetical protein [Pseudomonas sp. 1928-m]